MTCVALDSNILIYAEIEPESAKGMRSVDLILRTARGGAIPAQVLGEFLRFVQRRFPASFEEAIRQAPLYRSVFITPPTTDAIINKASELARASLETLGLRGLRRVRRSPRRSSADGGHAGRADPRRPASDEPFLRGEREIDRRSVGGVTSPAVDHGAIAAIRLAEALARAEIEDSGRPAQRGVFPFASRALMSAPAMISSLTLFRSPLLASPSSSAATNEERLRKDKRRI